MEYHQQRKYLLRNCILFIFKENFKVLLIGWDFMQVDHN